MKQLTKSLLLLVLFGLGSVACTKNFEEINTDPNRPQQINPGVMLGQMQYRIVNTSMQAARNLTHELMQVDAPRSSAGGGGVHRYVINPGSGVWTSLYANLTDIQDIYTLADGLKETNYKAIALVYKAWAYSILTDLYGDVPFSQATRATEGITKPTFDKQKDIYIQILKDLQMANELFDDAKILTYGGDQIYATGALTSGKNGGIQRWKKFTNSLRLRLLLRVLKRDGELNAKEQITAILADPVKFPTMAANADDAIFRYPGTFPYFNPYYQARTLDWRDGTYFAEFFVNRLNADNDPRRAIWMIPVTVSGQSVFRGIQSGYPTTTEYVVGQNSSYTDALKTLPQLGVMMSFAESEFIKAELALRGYNTGKTPKQHYEAGITASMVQWGAPMPATHLTQPTVAYPTGAPDDKQLEQIMMQKYIASIFVDYQMWFEKRRTGYPVLPRGAGIPAENQFPNRVPYPTYLQSLNPEGLATGVASMGGDNTALKVWWDK